MYIVQCLLIEKYDNYIVQIICILHFGSFYFGLIVILLLTQLLVSVGLEDYHLIAVWDWRKGRVLASVRGHTDRVSIEN